MRKITVIGCAGSGKTVFAKNLAAQLHIPLHSIDDFYYIDDWQRLSQDELKIRLIRIMTGDTWIIDGNYTKLIPLRLERVDTVIFFDLPKIVILWRIFKRYLLQILDAKVNARTQQILFPWHQIKLVRHYPKRRIYEMLKTAPKSTHIITFKNTQAVEQFLASVNSHNHSVAL